MAVEQRTSLWIDEDGRAAFAVAVAVEACDAGGDESEGGEKSHGEDDDAEDVGVGVGGEDDGVDEIRHRHRGGLSCGGMLLAEIRYIAGLGEGSSGGCEIAELGVAGCNDGEVRYIWERKTMLAHDALLAKNEKVPFVLEHGDCVSQQGQWARRSAMLERRKRSALLIEALSRMLVLMACMRIEYRGLQQK